MTQSFGVPGIEGVAFGSPCGSGDQRRFADLVQVFFRAYAQGIYMLVETVETGLFGTDLAVQV